MLGKDEDFEVGEKLVCGKYMKVGDKSLNVNFEYVITKIYDHSITILDESSDDEFNILKKKVDKYFIYNYCRTCHSMQGSTITKPITIFDWNHYFVDRKWIYTAITRAENFKNVFFYKGQKDDYDARVLRKYLGFKIENYKQQDEKAGRSINVDNFVDCNWFINQFGKACPRCGDCFKFDINNGKVVDCNLTANRIDVSECHHLNNVNPLCTVCNRKLAQSDQ